MTGKTARMTGIFVLLIIFLISAAASANHGRIEQELSGPGWRLWLDHGAVWRDDEAYLPPVDVAALPVNPPTCGWDALKTACDSVVAVPGTVEEYFWGEIGGVIPDDGGDYRGVSWWSRTFRAGPELAGKRITLAFESVNLRAEVFVNRRLVGYDVIGNTPFEVDITDAVVLGETNSLDIRITDPVGNFSWDDNILMRWGENLVPAVHGFGGITGRIVLCATDDVSIDDIHVQNRPDPKRATVFATLGNTSASPVKGDLTVTIHEWRNPAAVVWQKKVAATIPADGREYEFDVHAPDAKLWQMLSYRVQCEAELYTATVTFESDDGTIRDQTGQRFGFRWFDVGEKDGDMRFYLNGRRVFITAAMTRGFWPKNGIFPTPEMAEREAAILIDMGFNMMNFHRAIAPPLGMDYCDRYGVLAYQEPGGYRITPNPADNIDGPDDKARAWRREKLRRMVIRDRSCPSMVIFNLKNEATLAPDSDDRANFRMIHELDPTRIVTYNSDRNRSLPHEANEPDDPIKSWMRPLDPTIHTHGWWDHHHWYPFGGYTDDIYNNPRFYRHLNIVQGDSTYQVRPDEILFWGEEGGWGTMVRLGAIRDELMVTGASGFREQEHLDWYDGYNRFLDVSGFRNSYATVDQLMLSIGRNKHYYHGRAVENARMGNISDGFVFNGWASASTRSDIVDQYRNPTADPTIIAHYLQPLYVAVKLRNKVMPLGTIPVADFWIINENNLKGDHILEITCSSPDGHTVLKQTCPVVITGDEEYGELLVEGIELPAVDRAGYWRIDARILKDSVERANGFDDLYAVDLEGPGFGDSVAVIEDDGVVERFLRSARGITPVSLQNADIVVIGTHDPSELNADMVDHVMARVEVGATLIVLDRADFWAKALNRTLAAKPPVYRGGGIVKRGHRGRYFVSESPYFEGLPQAQAMHWEYQCFYQTREPSRAGNVSGLDLDPRKAEVIVAMSHQHTKDIKIALARLPLGAGQVFLSTMNIPYRLGDDSPQSAVAKKLFLNMLER